MPSHGEGWGGLFKVRAKEARSLQMAAKRTDFTKERFERIYRDASRRWTDHPAAARLPLLTKELRRNNSAPF
jgi:hypothetical protein